MKSHFAKRAARKVSRRACGALIAASCIAVAITAFSSIGCADPLVHLHTFGDINANASLAPNPKQTPVFASLLPRSLRALNALIDLPPVLPRVAVFRSPDRRSLAERDH